MDIAKRLVLMFLCPLFVILLSATAFDIGFTRIATHPQNVKKLAAESGIYSAVVPAVLDQTKAISTSAGSLDTGNQLIQKAASTAITPQFVRQNAEAVIDSVYSWLDGDTAQPEFKIDLQAAKTSFADQVAVQVQQNLSALKVCSTSAQAAAFNALTATCLPRGVTAASAAATVRNDLASSQDLVSDSSLTAANLKDSASGQSVFDGNLASAPKWYQRAKKTPYILSVLTVLTGLGIVLASTSWPKGLRFVGINLIVVGGIMLVFAFAFSRAVNSQLIPKIKLDNIALQADISHLATDLAGMINKNYWLFGGLYSVLGVGAYAVGETALRRRNPSSSYPAPKTNAPEAGNASSNEKPAETKKKPARKISVD